MTVIEKISEINEVIKEVFEFTQANEIVRADFEEYLSTMGARNIPLNQMEKIFLPYIFERNINEKSILEMFRETASNKEIADGLINAIASVFEIKRILKNGFELRNLINEKTYTVLSLTKMTNFRGVYAGQYIVARIFKSDEEYYVIEIANVLSHSQKDEAMRYAVMKLVQNPRLLYLDNPEKEEEIKSVVAEMYEKFIKAFDKDIILTTNEYADEIIGAFNDGEEIDLTDKGSKIETPRFFHVKELDNNYSNFLENSLGGFASHSEVYDVAVIFDKEKGLYAIPFYETFTKIFEGAEVEGAKDCIKYFLTNDTIPDTILERVSAQYKNFMEVINKYLEKEYSFEELIKEFKSEYLNNKLYSSATILYCSNAFSQVFDIISAPKPEPVAIPAGQKIGRNDPCPCGSGKKFKNCCMS